MSELFMTIGEDLPVLVDYDYENIEEIVIVNAVCIKDINIMNLLNANTLETISQNIFDSFDKELQEPEREDDDEYMH